MIIQEKLAQEKVEEPGTSGLTAGTSGAASSGAVGTGTAPAPPAGVPSSAVPAPGEPTGSSAAARRLAPDRTGAESDADLVNSQHLQVCLSLFYCFCLIIETNGHLDSRL